MLSDTSWTLHHGDCREVLAGLPDASVDSVVTDPPYELGFMGKAWDASGVAYDVALWAEVLRVLKPGGHLLAFGGTRTYHRLACAIEDAGFEIRDSLHWIYGSGFPKSLDVSKAIDKAAGAEREVVGEWHHKPRGYPKGNPDEQPILQGTVQITAPATPEAERWNGWGTALKPAHEPVVVARKPLVGTVAANVLAHGTGALNVDGCRVAATDGGSTVHATRTAAGRNKVYGRGLSEPGPVDYKTPDLGRWPANVVLDGEAAAELDRQSGESVTPSKVTRGASRTGNSGMEALGRQDDVPCYDDSGGASRFFFRADLTDDDLTSFRYVAKPDRAERDAGLGDLAPRIVNTDTPPGTAGSNSPRAGAGRNAAQQNFHPTVKPLDLMRWLVRLVTPPGGTVLEPFAGSGTTMAAALLEGFDVVGIELTADYLPIIEGRCRWAEREARFGPVQGPTKVRKDASDLSLFDHAE